MRTMRCAFVILLLLNLGCASSDASVGVGPASGKLAGITVTLGEVKPERLETGEIDKTKYVVTLRASK